MPNKYSPVTLNGSGAITDFQILEPRDGALMCFHLSKLAQTNNPAVTIKKANGEILLNAVAVSATTTPLSVPVRVEMKTIANAATGLYTNFALGGFPLLVTVTGGDNAGVLGIWIEWLS